MSTLPARPNPQTRLPDTAEPVLSLAPTRGLARHICAARDIAQGAALTPLALTLAWMDIRLRYRGSILGPFWLTATTAIMVAAMGLLYAYLFHISTRQYLPFLTFSLAVWPFVAGILREGCATFTAAAALITSSRMPFFVHALRCVARNVLVLAHTLPVVALVFILFPVAPNWDWQLLPAVLLWLIDCLALCLLLGVLSARFGDIPPLVASLTQVLFFITPVLWAPQLMATGQNWLLLDPAFALLEILRAPLLHDELQVPVWPAALGWSGLLIGLAWWLFARARAQLAYWV
ncbi:ABC transporter permease [Acetobacter vaccinii]|uniref:ABC transporter permease n=1 Tax=Acetobacter vaccinii TaxID=2592655 RepID=UPI001FED69C2|nr:ABC transporter permease [Acetobacter vaccinii]